jgi:hypothetical protein
VSIDTHFVPALMEVIEAVTQRVQVCFLLLNEVVPLRVDSLPLWVDSYPLPSRKFEGGDGRVESHESDRPRRSERDLSSDGSLRTGVRDVIHEGGAAGNL